MAHNFTLTIDTSVDVTYKYKVGNHNFCSQELSINIIETTITIIISNHNNSA